MQDPHGCDMTRKATWQSLRGPRGAQVAQTRGRRPRESTQTPVRGTTWREEGRRVKGPGNSLGAVIQ